MGLVARPCIEKELLTMAIPVATASRQLTASRKLAISCMPGGGVLSSAKATVTSYVSMTKIGVGYKVGRREVEPAGKASKSVQMPTDPYLLPRLNPRLPTMAYSELLSYYRTWEWRGKALDALSSRREEANYMILLWHALRVLARKRRSVAS